MAIVKGQSDLLSNPATMYPGADPEIVRGRPIVSAGKVSNAASDSAGSMYHLVDLPADALLDALTCFKVDGWGFATVSIGTETDIDALITVAKSAGATVTPITRLGATHQKRIWEIVGLAKPPANNIISLFAHGPANATAAGTMLFEIHYRFR
ncbi:hypothetical protein [Paracoccus sp. SSK6]|uniref:hypothetical protein n=1 Tax=Paracoccus sp. SSK6 TaxID=3143131 RepID=UPI0032196E11